MEDVCYENIILIKRGGDPWKGKMGGKPTTLSTSLVTGTCFYGIQVPTGLH